MPTPTIAAVIYEADGAIDDRLRAAVADCRRRGLRVGGIIQHNAGDCAGAGFNMEIEDLASGGRVSIVDPSITNPNDCRLDAAGLARAAAYLDPARQAGVDLVVVNRFGRQEALGRGLRAEIAALAAEGVPVLVAVRADFLADFEAFAGPDWRRIEAEAGPICGWIAALARGRDAPAGVLAG